MGAWLHSAANRKKFAVSRYRSPRWRRAFAALEREAEARGERIVLIADVGGPWRAHRYATLDPLLFNPGARDGDDGAEPTPMTLAEVLRATLGVLDGAVRLASATERPGLGGAAPRAGRTLEARAALRLYSGTLLTVEPSTVGEPALWY